jgi:hypothetical protein
MHHQEKKIGDKGFIIHPLPLRPVSRQRMNDALPLFFASVRVSMTPLYDLPSPAGGTYINMTASFSGLSISMVRGHKFRIGVPRKIKGVMEVIGLSVFLFSLFNKPLE